jgi:cell division protein FtsL
MKLIYIKSTMEPKNYATLRSLLKQEQGEKIAPYVFKLANIQTLQEYLKQERIKYETYQEIAENETEFAQEDQELEKAYKEINQDKERKKITKSAQKAALKDLRKRL